MFWQNFSYSGLRRMFAGLFIVIFISVNAGNFLLYAFFSSALDTEVKAGSLRILSKVKYATEQIYNDVTSLSTQLSHGNITITRLMFEKERDRILEYQAHQIMQNIMVSYPVIDYIAVYNERLDEIIATRYFDSVTEAGLKYLANYYYQRGALNSAIPITVKHIGSVLDITSRNTVTICNYSPLSLANDKGVLLVGINCNFFQQLIKGLDEGDLETIMILDDGGQVISHPDTAEIFQNYRDKEYLEEVFTGGRETFSYVSTIDSIKTYISYTKSEPLGWKFVSLVPYKTMASKLIFMRNLTLILTFCILCAGLFISYLLALNMYKPIQGILKRLNPGPVPRKFPVLKNENEYIEKQIDYLRSTADISESLIKSTIIYDLLKNQYVEDKIISNHIIGELFKEPYYLGCILSFDEQDEFDGLDAEDQAAERNKLIKIAVELLCRTCVSVDFVVLSSTDSALVLHLETGAVPENLIPTLMEINEMSKKFSGRSVSSAAGSIVNSIFAINDSYEEAAANLKERFFSGAGTVIAGQNREDRREIAYPRHTEAQLYQAVLSGDEKSINVIIGGFTDTIGKTTYEYARIYLIIVITETLSLCLADKLPVDPNSFHALIRKLQRTETLQKAGIILNVFYSSLAGQVHRDPPGSLPPFVLDAIKLAAENYQNPLFSINTAAENFSFTPAYFNREFKKYRRISYSEFLNEYRMEMACKLLKQTNKPVAAISAETGISNTTYFYTLFKKIYNVTPQQYRANCSRN